MFKTVDLFLLYMISTNTKDIFSNTTLSKQNDQRKFRPISHVCDGRNLLKFMYKIWISCVQEILPCKGQIVLFCFVVIFMQPDWPNLLTNVLANRNLLPVLRRLN